MKVFALLAFAIVFLSSCSVKDDQSIFSVVTHNAYAFFDGVESGTEYEGFDLKSGYSADVYRERIKQYAQFIAKYFSSYDVILFQEIENETILKDLLSAGLKRKGYLYYGCADKMDGYLSVGFISRIKPYDVIAHGIGESRLMLETVFSIGGESIHIINIHATSNLSSDGEERRYEEFSLLRSLMDLNAGDITIAMGDFNVDVKTGSPSLALKGSVESLSSPIAITGDGGEARDGVYYSPSVDMMENLGWGTYFYGGTWSSFDSALLSKEAFDWRGIEYLSSEIISPPEARDHNNLPKKFNLSDKSGFSDHYAFGVVFEF